MGHQFNELAEHRADDHVLQNRGEAGRPVLLGGRDGQPVPEPELVEGLATRIR